MIHKKTLMAVGVIGATLGLHGLAHASAPHAQAHRFDWTLTQAQPQGWSEGQPISLLLGVGLSDPHHLWVRESRPLPAPSLAPETVTGWTRPIGVRLAVRW